MKHDFAAKLQQQIGFLERSCVAYDSGNQEEALRIAVSLRVLFHDTSQSVSLLNHLGVKSSVRILSTLETAYTKDPKTGLISIYTPMWLNWTGERTPPLDDAERRDLIPAQEWWNEVILCIKVKLTRSDIVLSAANQDGGAHVVAVLNEKTKEVIAGVGTFTSVSQGRVIKRVLDNHHFPLLRQFAHEVLNSPDINKR